MEKMQKVAYAIFSPAQLVECRRVAVENDVYSVPASDGGLIAAQLMATFQRQKQAEKATGTPERNGT
jgi:hypothetical protein